MDNMDNLNLPVYKNSRSDGTSKKKAIGSEI